MPDSVSDNLTDPIIHHIKGDGSSAAGGSVSVSKASQRPSPAEMQAITDTVAKAADDPEISEQQKNELTAKYAHIDSSIEDLVFRIHGDVKSVKSDVTTRRFCIKLLRELGVRGLGEYAVIFSGLLTALEDNDPQNRLMAVVGMSSIGAEQFAINTYLNYNSSKYLDTWKEIARLVPFGDKIKELFSGIGEEYSYRAEMLSALNTAVRQEMANQLAPSLNTHIQAMPQANYEEKKEVARWVNEELRRFDLAIKGQNGQPSTLIAAPANSGDVDAGRFMLEHKTPEGKRVRPQLPSPLPSFELMEANPRREAIREWREKAIRSQGVTELG